jgi:hypothetical protein
MRFIGIARWTRETGILEGRFSICRARRDVLQLENRDGQTLACTAVDAAVVEMLGDSAPKSG